MGAKVHEVELTVLVLELTGVLIRSIILLTDGGGVRPIRHREQ
jgi:hypothetical protein